MKIDVEDELAAFARANSSGKEKVRTRLLKAGAKIDAQAARLAEKLDEAWFFEGVSDEEWIEKLRKYEYLRDVSDRIRSAVL